MVHVGNILRSVMTRSQSFQQSRHQTVSLHRCSQRLRPATACFSTTSGVMAADDKVYEVRTYNVKPEGMKPFMALLQEHFHIRMSYSKLVGFWSSEIGGINDVVHVWEYDNLSHRVRVRASLAGDKEYASKFYSKIMPMLLRMDNCLVKCLPGTVVQEPSTATGVYELQQFCFPGQEPKDVVDHVQSMKKPGATLLGSFYNIIGPLSGEMGTLLWQHQDIDNILKSSPGQSQEVSPFLEKYNQAPYSPTILEFKNRLEHKGEDDPFKAPCTSSMVAHAVNS